MPVPATGAELLSDEELYKRYVQECRRRFCTDLYWAATEGLGYDELDPELHGEFCGKLQGIINRCLKYRGLRMADPRMQSRMISKFRYFTGLIPRGHGKTTCVIAAMLSLAANDGNIRQGLKTGRLQNARDMMEELKSHLMGTAANSHFREWFPEACPPEDIEEFGTQDDFIAYSRTNYAKKEPTLLVGSTLQSWVSKHFDFSWGDDLINEETTLTPGKMEKSAARYRKDNALLEPGAPRANVGTVWDFSDLHNDMKNNEGNHYRGYEIYVREITEAKCDLCGTWFKFLDMDKCPKCGSEKWTEKPIWPSRYTLKSALADGPDFNDKGVQKISIPDLRDELGDYIFNCIYRNRAEDSEENSLPWEKIRVVKYDDIKDMSATPFMAIDTAGPDEGKEGSYFVITVADAIYPDIMVIKDIDRFRAKSDEFIDRVFKMFQTYQPVTVAIEKVSYGMVYSDDIENEMQKRGVWMNLEKVTRQHGPSKPKRIRGLSPRIERGHMWVLDTCPNIDGLRDEVSHFPHYKYRDILDTLVDLEKIQFAVDSRREETEDDKMKKMSQADRALALELRSLGKDEKVRYVHPCMGSEW